MKNIKSCWPYIESCIALQQSAAPSSVVLLRCMLSKAGGEACVYFDYFYLYSWKCKKSCMAKLLLYTRVISVRKPFSHFEYPSTQLEIISISVHKPSAMDVEPVKANQTNTCIIVHLHRWNKNKISTVDKLNVQFHGGYCFTMYCRRCHEFR